MPDSTRNINLLRQCRCRHDLARHNCLGTGCQFCKCICFYEDDSLISNEEK